MTVLRTMEDMISIKLWSMVSIACDGGLEIFDFGLALRFGFGLEPVHVQLGSSSAETCDFVCHRLLNSNFKKLFDNGRHTSQENTWSVC